MKRLRSTYTLADVFELNTALDNHTRRSCLLLLALLVLVACTRRPTQRHTWSQREKALEVARPRP